MNEKKSPGVIAPEMTWWPPYQSAPMMPKAASTSMSGSVSSSVRWSLRASVSSPRLTRSNRPISCGSRPNAFTILVPESTSCSSTFIWASVCCDRRLIR